MRLVGRRVDQLIDEANALSTPKWLFFSLFLANYVFVSPSFVTLY